MINKSIWGMIFFLTMAVRGYSQRGQAVYKDSSFIRIVLAEHNNFRAELRLPGLVWSSALAEDALVWAQHLASIRKGQHDMSIRGKEGENLWWGTAGAYSWSAMVDFWGNEKKDFVYGVFPEVNKSKSSMVGHYTQMVWKATTSVGCAIASNGEMDFLVCRYNPPGNLIGAKPY